MDDKTSGYILKWPKPQRDQRRVWMDEKDCERMTRTELNALQFLLIAINFAVHGSEDLRRRLECIPNGMQRMKMSLGGLRAVGDDLVGTITQAQARKIQNTMKDMEVRITPKGMPETVNVIFDREQAMALIDAAKAKCTNCAEDGESCRKCKLYQILEAYTPLDDYGSGLTCPYALIDWE